MIDVASAVMGTARENGQMAALISADAALHRRGVTLHGLATAASVGAVIHLGRCFDLLDVRYTRI